MNQSTFTIEDPQFAGIRVDRYVAEELSLFTRSQLKSREVTILVNGRAAKWSRHLVVGDIVALSWENAPESTITAEPIDLDVLYEDHDVVVVNKPQGMVVHPAAGNFTGTLVQGLLYRGDSDETELSEENLRPGIVHRLDKDTSGVIITAKNPEARQFLANQFAKRNTRKVYLAIVKGMVMPRKGRIESLICRDPKNRKRFTTSESEGKPSVTEYSVLHQWDQYAFVSLHPLTGRTHQLRVHLTSKGHPILGDPTYSRPDRAFPLATLMLHAHRLTIMLPRRLPDEGAPLGYHYVGGETLEFRAPLPERFKSIIRLIAQKPLGTNS
ncbi:MAG TPA: RluA family pseudouridine synthase [Spirochaetia bacterium]|nr:RluA family pseudouridine synthase [Spirochaetia bacterium]